MSSLRLVGFITKDSVAIRSNFLTSSAFTLENGSFALTGKVGINVAGQPMNECHPFMKME